jgi:hypothetical protein
MKERVGPDIPMAIFSQRSGGGRDGSHALGELATAHLPGLAGAPERQGSISPEPLP